VLRSDELAVPVATIFDHAALGFEVDVHDAKAARKAPRPFEVVQQRPGEVAAQRDASLQCGGRGLQVACQVTRALRIGDAPVPARIRVGCAVFRDCQARDRIVGDEPSSLAAPSI